MTSHKLSNADLNLQAKIARFAEAKKMVKEWKPSNGDWGHVDSRREWNEVEREYHLGLRTGYGPVVGMPCTYTIGSDDYAAEVVKVSASGHQIWVKTGHDGPEGELFTRRKYGEYLKARQRGGYITFFLCETKLDPSF